MNLRFADLPPHVQLAFDVSPLAVPRFTGVSNVVAKLLAHFRSAGGGRLHAFNRGVLVGDAVIAQILESRSGVPLVVRDHDPSVFSLVESHPDHTFLALFGNVKSVHGLFPFEAQIVHDITVVLIPECHTSATIDHHMQALERDLSSNDLSICVSDATRDDLISYLAVPPRSAIVIRPGVDPPRPIDAQLRSFDERHQIEPYFIVLNTIEPRKNIPLVLRMLRDHPECVDGLLALFVGPHGWGPSFQALVAAAGVEDLVAKRRIRYLGFVSDFEREVLLRKATFLVFASFYEGFGLPVLEALRLGCPVVASFSSSIPEAGGSAACYFDPFDVRSLTDAVTRVRAELAVDPASLRERGRAHALQFGWDRYCIAVEAAICSAAIEKLELKSGSDRYTGAMKTP